MRGDTINESIGLFGGREGKAGRCRMEQEPGKLVDVPVNEQYFPDQDKQIEFFSPGGGGFGDPLRRDAHLVADDLRCGYISRRTAENSYGMVFNTDGAADFAATEMKRSRLRRTDES